LVSPNPLPSSGCLSPAVTRHGWRWFVEAHSGDGRRYIVQSDELLTAFLELESNIGEFSASKNTQNDLQTLPRVGSTAKG
jgi:hypothetical protein